MQEAWIKKIDIYFNLLLQNENYHVKIVSHYFLNMTYNATWEVVVEMHGVNGMI